MADKILSLFQSPFDIYGQVFLITSSIGIATYPVDGEDTENLIKDADTAMYMAKEKGKNQYAYTTKEMKDELINNSKLAADLYYAIEQNQLIVYYQPQIDLNTQTIIGVEALLRWNHPIHGMISPFIFIPLAEKNGLINSIGAWVLKEACRQNKEWQDRGFIPLRIAVNLSGVQFMNPHIANQVKDIIEVTGLNPKYLELEITESIAVKEISYALDTLNSLKELGITIAIDDFGTEYSSLNRLKQLPIDRIKIDMQFIQGIENSEKDKAITMVIINLAKSLNLSVMAEGVETQKQMEFLNQKMCDDVQGYYYYKPMPADEFTEVLKDIELQLKVKLV